MFGKMMNRFYYGKSGQGDYTPEDLPQTRWKLFWEMLKIRFSGLCRLNLVYAVVWIPAFIVGLRAVTQWASAMNGLLEMQEAGTLAGEALAEASGQFGDWTRALIQQTLLWMIPCIAITGPFTAGLCYVTRNWARDEHAFAWADYRDAIKENWKQGLAVSAITGFMPLMLYVCWTFYGDMSRDSMLFLVPQLLSMMLGIGWLCSLLYQYPLMVTYQLRFRDLLRNALLLTAGRLPMTLGLKLLSLVPILIAAFCSYYLPYMAFAMMAFSLYYLVIGFSLSRFVGASYANAVFDRFINPRIEGAVTGRGLYREEDEDEDEGESA